MYDKIPSKILEQIFTLLERKNQCRNPSSNGGFADEICRNRWTFRWQLDDMILCSDSRCDYLDLEVMSKIFDLPFRWAYRMPRFATTDPGGSLGVSAVDAAALLIHMEAIGFDTRPRALVEQLKPLIDTDGYVSDSELLILRYDRERLRSLREMRADTVDDDGEWVIKRLKGPDGRKIKLIRVGRVAYRLEVKGPKYRRPKVREIVKCAECHDEYLPGDRESSLRHRTEHSKRMRIFDPKPTPAFVRRIQTNSAPELVTPQSPLWMHKAVYQRAVYFRREFHYDFVQWAGSEREKNHHPQARGHLFSSKEGGAEGTIIGACGFWHDDDGWRLQWVWLCPPARRTGALSHRWPGFLELYGDFWVEQPLSDAMRQFLVIHGTPAQRAAAAIP